jgi:phosphoglycerate kinase
MRKQTVKDFDVAGKKVLVRVDFNEPIDALGNLKDDTRLRASLPTVEYLIEKGCRVIICSHLDRPGGKVVPEMSLAPMARRFAELLKHPVAFVGDCLGPEVEDAIAALQPGDVLLLENLRFHAEEEANDEEFAAALAELADFYVNDAFGASHRRHASVVGVGLSIPGVAGLLLEKELIALSDALDDPERPFAAVVGGAKVTGKLGVLENVVEKVDTLLVGGGMAATFFAAGGLPVGASPVETDRIDYVRRLMAQAAARGVKLLLPEDVIVSAALQPGASCRAVDARAIPAGMLIADIGPRTIEIYTRALGESRTVIWNGPMGVFEISDFARGTHAVARALAALDATTVIGGGSTAEVVNELGLQAQMSHVSTGGGASLEFLEGKVLPGVDVLEDR